jgi:Na+-driven multidrug efflux pump
MEFAVMFMRIFLCTMVINGVQFLSANFFSSIGKPLKGVFLSMSRQCLLFIPLMLVIPRVTSLGLMGIIIAGPIADVIAVSLSILFVFFEFKAMTKLEKEKENA